MKAIKPWVIKWSLILGMYVDLLRMLIRFAFFKITGQGQRAAKQYSWLTFFWNCKPESIRYKGVEYKI